MGVKSTNQKALESSCKGVEKPTFGSEKLMELIQKEVPDLESITLIGICTDICVISNALLAKKRIL